MDTSTIRGRRKCVRDRNTESIGRRSKKDKNHNVTTNPGQSTGFGVTGTGPIKQKAKLGNAEREKILEVVNVFVCRYISELLKLSLSNTGL